MKSGLNDDTLPTDDQTRKGVETKSKAKNLEFNFDSAARSSTVDEPKAKPIQKNPSMSTTFEDSKSRLKNLQRENSDSASSSTAKTQSQSNMSNPVFSQYQQNVQRQSREQKAVGSLLSGVAAVLIGSIILVGILALFGGWALHKQIKQQSTTVDQLNKRLSAEIQTANINLQEANVQIQTLLTQTQAQKQQLGWLQGQIEDAKNQQKKTSASQQAKLQNLENRLKEIEKDNIR
jgi:hypothetical protein